MNLKALNLKLTASLDHLSYSNVTQQTEARTLAWEDDDDGSKNRLNQNKHTTWSALVRLLTNAKGFFYAMFASENRSNSSGSNRSASSSSTTTTATTSSTSRSNSSNSGSSRCE